MKMFFRHSILSCIILILFSSICVNCRVFKRSTIENLLTQQEAEHYLPKKDSEQNYEVIKLFTKRSTDDTLQLHFKAFQKREAVDLTLQDVFMPENLPVWLGVSQNGQHKYLKANESLTPDSLKLYISAGGASFSIAEVMKNRARREIKINGVMNGITIRSLSPTIIDRVNRAKREVNEDHYYIEYSDDSYTDIGYHFITYEQYSDNIKFIRDNEYEINETSSSRVKRSDIDGMSDILYPRILLTTHYNNGFTSTDDPNIESFILYVLTFWATVHMKFYSFENPKIRLRLRGIIIESQYEALPYISENQLLADIGAIEIHDTLRQVTEYYRKQTGELDAILDETRANMAISMTNLRLCELSEESKCKILHGISGLMQSCERVHDTKAWKINLFAIVHDAGFSFNGIFSAAHEVGHLLGADSDPGNNFMETDYNMMSEISHQIRIPVSKNYWSAESIQAIKATALDRASSNCMNFNEKPEGKRITLPLPGERMNRDAQCVAKGAENSCGRNSCLLRCECRQTSAKCSSECTIKGYVLDGTSCRNHIREHCINGKCVRAP